MWHATTCREPYSICAAVSTLDNYLSEFVLRSLVRVVEPPSLVSSRDLSQTVHRPDLYRCYAAIPFLTSKDWPGSDTLLIHDLLAVSAYRTNDVRSCCFFTAGSAIRSVKHDRPRETQALGATCGVRDERSEVYINRGNFVSKFPFSEDRHHRYLRSRV